MRKVKKAINYSHKKFCARCAKLTTRFSVGVCFNQGLALLNLVVSGACWPLRKFSARFQKVLKPYPKLHCLYSHSAFCVLVGLSAVFASFALENYSHHYVWNTGCETLRAAGVCPLWESLARLFKFGEDLEA